MARRRNVSTTCNECALVAASSRRGPSKNKLPASSCTTTAAKHSITDLSAHLATSRVLDPLQCLVLSLGGGNETAQIHQIARWSGCLAARCACAATIKRSKDRLLDR